MSTRGQGIRLKRHYVHKMCTPTRTSVQSGRLPVHVNTGLGDVCDDATGIPLLGRRIAWNGSGRLTAWSTKKLRSSDKPSSLLWKMAIYSLFTYEKNGDFPELYTLW